jgi:hypothetical protein
MKETLLSVARGLDAAVEARRVFQPNARTSRAFDARITGTFRANGPNPWDTFRFVPEEGGPFRVFPGLEVQVEPQGAALRLRVKGKVRRLEWVPEAPCADIRAAFLDGCVTGFRNRSGIGATAFIARTLGA